MPAAPRHSTPTFPLDPDQPVDVTIDLQGKHRAVFRLYGRSTKSSRWEEIKTADHDMTITLSAARAKPGLLCEFKYWSAGTKYRAAVIIKQLGVTKVIDVSEADNAAFAHVEVAFE